MVNVFNLMFIQTIANGIQKKFKTTTFWILKLIRNYNEWKHINAIQNNFLGMSDELKLKHNQKKKLNEWNKSLFFYI